MWAISRRLLSQNISVKRNLLRKSESSVGCFHSEPCFARKKPNDTNEKNEIKDKFKISRLFQPVAVPVKERTNADSAIELTGQLSNSEVLRAVNQFTQNKSNRDLSAEYGLDKYIQQRSFASFRQYCFKTTAIPAELYIKLYDISKGAANADDLFPYYLQHTREIFPHLNCMNDLKKISDLTNPPSWYPQARSKTRKIIFHAGPTNSGKTYHAMQRFLEAESGVYCGPLKLLAMEVFQKSNDAGTVCDLVTGEEKRFGNPDGSEANHLATTIEMASVERKYDVAIIDEIQMLKEPGRGWAWTRAFLGLNADEIHVCGEAGTRELLEKLCLATGEILEYNHYDRLTELTIEKKAIDSFENLQPGDCIVCFNKNDIYSVSREIESLGKEVAVIYGSLPPNTKLAQAAKFNDPNNTCKIMVATDAIGMGLNLCIRRVIFYSMVKLQQNGDGDREITSLSISQTLQIAGRAGRFKTQWEHGYVTTFKRTDLPTLTYLLGQKPEAITQAGLYPTADQIESYAFHLPNSSLSGLLDIFTSLSTVNNDLYFMCNTDDFKELANSVQHISLPLRVRYVYCCAPVNRKQSFITTMFTKFATEHSKYEKITFDFLFTMCGLPVRLPQSIADLIQLENIFDVMDLYLWLSFRFADIFPDGEKVRSAQAQLDDLIHAGVAQITKLINESTSTNDNQELNNALKSIPKVITKEQQKDIANQMDRRDKERFSDYLIRKGVINQRILQQLQNELSQHQTGSTSISTSDDKCDRSDKKSKRTKKSRTRK